MMFKGKKGLSTVPNLWPVIYRRRDTGEIVGTGVEPAPELRLGPFAISLSYGLGTPVARWVGFRHGTERG